MIAKTARRRIKLALLHVPFSDYSPQDLCRLGDRSIRFIFRTIC